MFCSYFLRDKQKVYVFNVLKKDEVYSIIRENNISSINVAKKNGMVKVGKFIKHCYGMDMPHYLFCVKAILN
jgi:RimJ/RimL family protein N-acetyltransferase